MAVSGTAKVFMDHERTVSRGSAWALATSIVSKEVVFDRHYNQPIFPTTTFILAGIVMGDLPIQYIRLGNRRLGWIGSSKFSKSHFALQQRDLMLSELRTLQSLPDGVMFAQPCAQCHLGRLCLVQDDPAP